MARSTAERENHMVTSSATVCITPRESGHFTCYKKQTHHELPTVSYVGTCASAGGVVASGSQNIALTPWARGSVGRPRGNMSPVKNRRRLPTLINRGLGLLEVIMPCGSSDPEESALPPGQRDTSGFWFPAGYDTPADIFTPLQRELQENQRRIQRRRVGSKRRPPAPAGADRPLGM